MLHGPDQGETIRRERASERRVKRDYSFEGRVLLIAALSAGVSVAMVGIVTRWSGDFRLGLILGLLAGIAVSIPLAQWLHGRLARHLRAVATAVSAIGDGDFAVGVENSGIPELDALIAHLEGLSEGLREERTSLHQRELLLDTVVQATPVAMALLDARDRVVYSNQAARRLLAAGAKIAGLSWETLVSRQSAGAQKALQTPAGGLFEIEDDNGERRMYLISSRDFRLNARPHRLVLVQHLTRELARQEVATWKKVIRVISHELNNSIAPISSMVHSSQKLVERGETERLSSALAAVAERVKHLAGFIERYAAFARLPTPDRVGIAWTTLVESVRRHWAFELPQPLPDRLLHVDRGQFEQALINLLKNAHESGSAATEIELVVRDLGDEFLVEVNDRGPGMTEDTLSHALIPFYSTKREGSGIGLSLVREIIEAHGGRLSLHNRPNAGLTVRLHMPAGA